MQKWVTILSSLVFTCFFLFDKAASGQGVEGEIVELIATVNFVAGTDFMPGDNIAVFSDAVASVDAGLPGKNIRLSVKFFNNATMEEIVSESNSVFIASGTGDELSRDAGYNVPGMTYANAYTAVIKLLDSTDAMNEIVLDSDFRTFTTD